MSASAAEVWAIRACYAGRTLRKGDTMTEARVAKIAEAMPTCAEPGRAGTPQGMPLPAGDASSALMASCRRRCVLLGAAAGLPVQAAPRPPAEPPEEPEEEPLELPPAATAPRPLLLELREAYETAHAAERAVERQHAHVRQRCQALLAQVQSVHDHVRGARDRGTAHLKLNEVMGLHDQVAELEAQGHRLQRQRDVQALAVLAAAAAYGECRAATRRVLNALRWAQQAAAALPPALAAMELDRALQAQTQLAALIGEAEVQALVEARAWRPDGLQER